MAKKLKLTLPALVLTGLAGLVALCGGCSDPNRTFFKKATLEDGCIATAWMSDRVRHIKITYKNPDDNSVSSITAEDSDNFYGFDSFNYNNIREETPIEKYKNPDELEKTYQEIKNQ